MAKGKTSLDGVQISGSEKTGNEESRKKGKLNEEPKTTQRQKGKSNSNSTIGREKENHVPEQEPEEKEPADNITGNTKDLHQSKIDQEGTDTGARNQENQGNCKPKTIENLQVIISNPDL